MIHVPREGEPEVLRTNGPTWLRSYEAKRATKPSVRPPSSQYAHPSVKGALRAMSHGKCFYCEVKCEGEVDHYVEVAERPDLAFTWTNLYLACSHCNDKAPNRSIANADCVDPCDATCDPADHLELVDEVVRAKTPRGAATIKKYRLDDREGERRRVLLSIYRAVSELTQDKGVRYLSDEEKRELWKIFADDRAEMAQVGRAYLQRNGLIPTTP